MRATLSEFLIIIVFFFFAGWFSHSQYRQATTKETIDTTYTQQVVDLKPGSTTVLNSKVASKAVSPAAKKRARDIIANRDTAAVEELLSKRRITIESDISRVSFIYDPMTSETKVDSAIYKAQKIQVPNVTITKTNEEEAPWYKTPTIFLSGVAVGAIGTVILILR